MTKQQVPEMIELVTCEELVAKCPSAAEHFRHKDDISGENFDNLPTLEKWSQWTTLNCIRPNVHLSNYYEYVNAGFPCLHDISVPNSSS